MFKFLSCWVLSFALIGSTALAQDRSSGRTTAMSDEVSGSVYQSPFSFTPQVGALGFADSNNNYTSRGLVGLTADLNADNLMPKMDNWHFGFETGLLYSHLGATGASFWGQNGDIGGGANSFVVPIHLTGGYAFSDRFLVSALVGSSMIYRSISNQMTLGRHDFAGNNQIDFFPSLGLNAGWSLSRNVGIALRGDYIPVPAKDNYTASIGATIGLG